MKYTRIAQAIIETPWAIQPVKLGAILEFVHAKIIGAGLPEIQAAARMELQRVGATAVIPIHGTIMQRANMMTEFSGGTSTERLGQQLRMAIDDPAVSNIVLDVDSPGGSVFGVQEMADTIYHARAEKPIVAVANSVAASAAYWLASAASEFVVTPSGEVGSIGVIMAHTDWSQWNADKGLKVSYIYAGDHKAEGNPDEPLDDQAREYFQSHVDAYYQRFVGAVARNRGVSASHVNERFGQGRMFLAEDAKAAGMVDRIATLEQVISGLQPKRTPARSKARADLNRIKISAPVD